MDVLKFVLFDQKFLNVDSFKILL